MDTSRLKLTRTRWTPVLASMACVLAAACEKDTVGVQRAPLEAVCAESAESVPAGAWQCPDPLTVECEGGDGTSNVDFIYLVRGGADAGPNACDGVELSVSDPGPYAVGAHDIDIHASAGDAGNELLCTAGLTVTDTVPPVIEGKTIVLWPPNHKVHTVTAADCVEVRDACDGEIPAYFTRVSSDEPNDALGDGHHAPDIVANDGCESVQLRAERQGGGNGRVYTLDVEATDAAGNRATGTCYVLVPHDRSSDAAIDDGPATITDAYAECPDRRR